MKVASWQGTRAGRGKLLAPPSPSSSSPSNLFAIKGPRSLYFLPADVADRFHPLKYGLAMVLTFIGTKMLIAPWYHVPVQASLAIVVVLIGASVIASLIATRNQPFH